MPIIKTKGGYRVKSYETGKFHRGSTGGIKTYSSHTAALKSAGTIARRRHRLALERR